MLRKDFYEKCKDPQTAYEFAKQTGIIRTNPPICLKCGKRMFIERGKTRLGLDGRYRCPRPCRNSIALTFGSIFFRSHLKFNAMLELLWFYSEKTPIRRVAQETSPALSNIVEIYKKIDICIKRSIIMRPLVGFINPYDVYEVDECHLHINTHNHGRILHSQRYWVVGIICRQTKQVRLTVTRVRSSHFLSEFIVRNIPRGACVITDMWRGYSRLSSLGYEHKTINHSDFYVDPDDPEVHTNNIERVWRSLREWLPFNLIEGSVIYRLRFFEVEFNNGINTTAKRFDFLIDCLRFNIEN